MEVDHLYRKLASRYVSLIIAALTMLTSSCSQRNSGFTIAPMHQDLGFVQEGGTARAVFLISNFTAADILITEISPSCKCTSVKLEGNLIPVGATCELVAEAALEGYSGQQDFSIFLRTNSRSYPHMTVSFSAIAPATGDRFRQYELGRFRSNQTFSTKVPMSAISAGALELTGEKPDNIHIDLVNLNAAGTSELHLEGVAPDTIGDFRVEIELREYFPEHPELGVGTVTLNLRGEVVACWDIPRELYAGFIEANTNSSENFVTWKFKKSHFTADKSHKLAAVTCEFDEPWLELLRFVIVDETLEVTLALYPDRASSSGAQKASGSFILTDSDGYIERYETTIFSSFN